MNYRICTALVAASGDPWSRYDLPQIQWKNLGICERNATSRNAIIHYRNTKRKSKWNIVILRVKVTGNRDEIISQY